MIYELIGIPGVGKTHFLNYELERKEGQVLQSSLTLRWISKILLLIFRPFMDKVLLNDDKLKYKYIQYFIADRLNLDLYADESITQYIINRLLEKKITLIETERLIKELISKFALHVLYFKGDEVSNIELYQRLQRRNTNKYSDLSESELTIYRLAFDKEVQKILKIINDRSCYSYYDKK